MPDTVIFPDTRILPSVAANPTTDPAVITNNAYQAIEDLINATPGDVSDEHSAAMSAAYKTCMATAPTSITGAVGAYGRWSEGDDDEAAGVVATLITDLERLSKASPPTCPPHAQAERVSVISAMSARLSEIHIEDLPTDGEARASEEYAIRDAAPMIQPRTLSDLAFQMVLVYGAIDLLAGLCNTDGLTAAEKKEEAKRYRKPLEIVMRKGVDLLLRNGAKLCPVTQQYHMCDYLDPRLTEARATGERRAQHAQSVAIGSWHRSKVEGMPSRLGHPAH
jgi:hypothetical protein